MEILERFMLRRQLSHYSLKYSLAKLQLHSLSPQAQSLPLQAHNKQLYLRYMEQVLHSKEQELIQLQEQLQKRTINLEEEEAKQQILNPLAMSHQAEVLARQAEMVNGLLGEKEQNNNIAKGMRVIEEACRKNYLDLQEEMMREYGQFTRERRELGERLSKLGELERYEKYLMELQRSLQEKQYSILLQERELGSKRVSGSQHTFSEQHSRYLTQQSVEQNPHETTTRSRRNKIFTQNHNSSSLSQQWNGGHPHMQSSQIMQGQGIQRSPEQLHHQQYITAQQTSPLNTNRQELTPILEHVETQTDLQRVPYRRHQNHSEQQQALKKLKEQAHLIKFTRLWLRFSDRAGKGGLNHHKTMALYSWRLNTLYDETIYLQIKANLEWPGRLPPLAQLPPINYPQLSLKKKLYLQKFWKHERYKLYRKRVLVALKNVIRNRNRRERTAVVLYFKRFQFHAQLLSAMRVVLMNVEGGNSSLERSDKMMLADLSRLNSSAIGSSSGVIESKPTPNTKQNKKSAADGKAKAISRPNPNSGTSSSHAIRMSGSKSHTRNSRISQLPNGLDMQRLREYIRGQQEIQARLAIECAQTESVFRLTSALVSTVGRHRHSFWTALTQKTVQGRIVVLERAVNSQQFKWELFMAKARLALTNNTNKVSHLEHLLAFLGSDR